jgi:CSLREA domain-containing protein
MKGLRWLLVSCLVGLVPGSALAQPTRADALVLAAPARAAVGDAISLVFRFDGPPAAGYQARLSYDVGAAHLTEVQNRDGSAAAERGWQVRDLGPVELVDGIEFGAYSCLRPNCAGGGQTASAAAAGSGVLARIVMRADEVGPLQLRLSDVTVVDPTGAVFASGGTQVVTIEVTGPGRGAPHDAPPAQTGRAADPDRHGQARDATGDGRVDETDVTAAALSWVVAHSRGSTCAPGTSPAADANADGCVDVADVQTFAGAAEPLPPAHAFSPNASFVVDSVGDEDDAAPGDGVCATPVATCTLRAAIDEANALTGPDTIDFAIPGSGVQTIQLTTSLPQLTDTTGGMFIDGYTQPGASVNTDPLADNAQLMVAIRGTGPDGVDGLRILSAGNTVRGVSLFNLRRPIYMYGVQAHDNTIIGCFIGTNGSGTFHSNAFDLFGTGVVMDGGAAKNRIGTTSTADRNVISGNSRHGIATYGDGTNSNVIYNNIVGLTPDGTARLPNVRHGVDINGGSSYNVIGGTRAGMRNVLSGNGMLGDPVGPPSGIEISHGSTTTGNKIVGNYIGSDLHGEPTDYTYNGMYGVHIEDSVNTTVVSRNVILDNPVGGVRFLGPVGSGNRVKNNLIGVSPTGQPGPNGAGVVVDRNSSVTIGPANTIAYNGVGIDIASAATANRITRNSIYANDGLGIDLDPLGEVNPNDPNDIDAGANNKQNFPVIGEASPTHVSGTTCAGCTVEIFLASDPEGSAYGEGKTFIKSTTADPSGKFSARISVNDGDVLTATATRPTGDTSEFSENVTVADAPQAPAAPLLAFQTGPRRVTIRWSTPAAIGSAITSYEIYRGTSSGGETFFATIGAMNRYLDVEVEPDTTYFYKVAAVNSAGTGPPSLERAVTPTSTGIVASDRFDRTVPNGFGSADIGGNWGVSSTSQTEVENSEGVIYGWTEGNRDVSASMPGDFANQDVLALVRLSASDPVGAAYRARIVARSQSDPRDGYAARLVHEPNGSVIWELVSVQNGGGEGTTVLASGPLASAATGTSWWVRLDTQSTTIRVKFWQTAISEPVQWTAIVQDSVWSSGGAALGVFTSPGMTAPFPDTGFASFDAIDLG